MAAPLQKHRWSKVEQVERKGSAPPPLPLKGYRGGGALPLPGPHRWSKMTTMTRPCGKPARWFGYWRPRHNAQPLRYTCSTKCMDRLVELQGIVPNERMKA